MDAVTVDHIEETSIRAVCPHCGTTMLTITTTHKVMSDGTVTSDDTIDGRHVVDATGTVWPYCPACVVAGRTTIPEEPACRS